jgi:hypothetical protein
MDYWVYENFPTNQATIHGAECGFCNHGQGKNLNGKSTRNGTWHGPFQSINQAITASFRASHSYLVFEHANQYGF